MTRSRAKSFHEKRKIKATRDEMVEAARRSARPACCDYCRTPLRVGEATLDHVIAISQGGLTISTNLALCCGACNSAKGSMSRSQFLAAIKGPVPRGRDSMLAAWARRKIALAADRACRRLAAAAGLSVGSAP